MDEKGAVEIPTEARKDAEFPVFRGHNTVNFLRRRLLMAKQSNVYANSSVPDPVRRSKKRKLDEEEEDEGPSSEGFSTGSEEGKDIDQEDEEDSDMDPEKPRAVAWEDDEEPDESVSGESDEEESISGSDGDGDGEDQDARLNRLQRGMASLPFGTLLQAKKEAEPDAESEKDSTSESDEDSDDGPPDEEDAKPTHWKIAADRKAVPKRVTKTAYVYNLCLWILSYTYRHNLLSPAVETSKKPVSRFRQIVEVKKMEARDPRFSTLSAGEFDATKFASSYGFITDIQKDEAKKIRHTIRDIKKALPEALPNARQQGIKQIEELKKTLNRTETSIKKARKEAREREVLMQARKEEKERRKDGKGE
ncbi:rRNA biogenesis protein rrp36, partial [Tulasnella sp. 417]